jgi:aryl-alcohol dehydrogenase-like predicted oxidoreductase
MTAIEENLQRLGTDWVDLYQVHRPAPRTPIEEILRVLAGLITAEEVRYIGCSNHPSWQVAEAQHTSSVIASSAFSSYEDEYSLLVGTTEPQLIPAAATTVFGLLPYFSLGKRLYWLISIGVTC